MDSAGPRHTPESPKQLSSYAEVTTAKDTALKFFDYAGGSRG